MSDDIKESYLKTIGLIEGRISESSSINDKMNWIKTYLSIVMEDDLNTDLLDISKEIEDSNMLNSSKDSIYKVMIPESLLERNIDNEYWRWDMISRSQDLSREFILKYKDLIDFNTLNLKNYIKLENSDLNNISEINWDYISMRDDLSKEFISEFKDRLNWSYVTVNIFFSEEEMKEYSDYIDWRLASICQEYSEDFANEHGLYEYLDEMSEKSKKSMDSWNEVMEYKEYDKFVEIEKNNENDNDD